MKHNKTIKCNNTHQSAFISLGSCNNAIFHQEISCETLPRDKWAPAKLCCQQVCQCLQNVHQYWNISTGRSICLTVEEEGQGIQKYIAWSGSILEALDSGWYLFSFGLGLGINFVCLFFALVDLLSVASSWPNILWYCHDWEQVLWVNSQQVCCQLVR